MGFRDFLLNEERSHLGHRVGDVLNSLHNIQSDMENLGSRHLARLADDIVNQLRKILHGNWTDKQKVYLKDVQRVAVAIKRAIEERDDLQQIVPAATQQLQTIAGKMGLRVNNLTAPPDEGGEDISQQDFQLTGNGPEQQQQQQQQQPQQQPQQQQNQQSPDQPPPGADTGGFDPNSQMGAGTSMGQGLGL